MLNIEQQPLINTAKYNDSIQRNCYQPNILSEAQKQKIKKEFYKNWKTCENEMIEEKGKNTITSSRQPLAIALKQVMEKTGVLAELLEDPRSKANLGSSSQVRNINKLLKELKLKCPTCGQELTINTKVGKYLGDDEFWHCFADLTDSQTVRPKNNKVEFSNRAKIQNKVAENLHQTQSLLQGIFPKNYLLVNVNA